jgi:hypothetical protein
MDRNEIIRTLGEGRFKKACATARKKALDPHYGRSEQEDAFDPEDCLEPDVAHQIVDLIEHDPQPLASKLALALQLYDEMPCYALIFYVKCCVVELSQDDRTAFWTWVRARLESADPTLPPPLAYSLWCDYFEDGQIVEEAWTSLVSPLPSEQALQTLLVHSGPVPFALKKKVYALLIGTPRWHYYVFRSLLHSQFDVFGSIEPQEAWSLLEKLDLPEETESLGELKEKLRQNLSHSRRTR